MRIYFMAGLLALVTACGAETQNNDNAEALAESSGVMVCPPSNIPPQEVVCSAVYDPVCAQTETGEQTFSNSCKACAVAGAESYKKGAC